jgi:cyanophycinase-like exopeptidase
MAATDERAMEQADGREPSQTGWLALLGGGEFSFGETEEADRAWLEKAPPGPIGFVPAASGSLDYSRHFADYLAQRFERDVELLPIYRPRDARRGRNAERIAACAAVYLGGGVADHLVEALADSPALAALGEKLRSGGVVAAIGAAAQACGELYRGLRGGRPEPGLGLLPGVAIEANFDPAHDRRLRSLLAAATGVERALGIPSGGALLVGPDGRFEAVGDIFALAGPEADLVPLVGEAV